MPPRTIFLTNARHCQRSILAGKKELGDFTANPSAWFRDHHIELQLGTEVQAIDPGAHTLSLPDGSTVHYDKLLLATGSRSRRPPIPGADAANVHYLRTIDDAETLKSSLVEGSSLAVVGAGWIGLEVAAGARERGATVTVVEAADVPLQASLGKELGEVFARCTAITVSTCAWAPRSTRSPPPAARPPD